MTRPMLSLALVAMLAAPVLAAPPPHGGQPHPDRMAAFFRALGLSAEQTQQVQAIRKRHHDASRADVAALKARMAELSTLLRSTDATVDQAIAKQREIDALKSRLAEGRVKAWFETRALLTPEQIRRLPAWKADRRHDREDW